MGGAAVCLQQVGVWVEQLSIPVEIRFSGVNDAAANDGCDDRCTVPM